MTKISRIRMSRQEWKVKAVSRADQLRRQRRKSARSRKKEDARRLELEEWISFLECENAALKSTAEQCPPAVVGDVSLDRRRTTCVMMVIEGTVSFRAVPRIWSVLQRLSWVKIQIPHFTSVIHWTLRAGMTIFNAVGPMDAPWVAVIDCSIDIGTRKALVVLRVPLLALHQKQDAIGLQDCECIGLKIATRWNGTLVQDALTDIFSKAGMPRAIIKDGGTDIKRGVELYREAHDSEHIQVIEDVGHLTANALKAEFAKQAAFTKFLDIVSKGASRIRQTNLAWLLPPKVGTKSRFQGITQVAEWAGKILNLMGGPGRSENDSEVEMLREAFRGLSQLRGFLEQFCATCRVTERFLKLLKRNGLNQATGAQAKIILKQLPQDSQVRARLSAWIDRHLKIQEELAVGHLPLLVSSDVVESLFGKFKTIIQRNPQAELNRLVYIIPLLCGTHTSAEIDRALRGCSHGQMLEQIQKTIPRTLRQQRHRVLDSASGRVPETAPRGRIEAG